MAKIHVQDQIEAVIEVIDTGGKTLDVEKLDAVVTTLMYLRDHRPEIELAAMIQREILTAIPGTKLTAIRPLIRADEDAYD